MVFGCVFFLLDSPLNKQAWDKAAIINQLKRRLDGKERGLACAGLDRVIVLGLLVVTQNLRRRQHLVVLLHYRV